MHALVLRAWGSYLLLFIVSFAVMGLTFLQRVLVLCWLLEYCALWVQAGRKNWPVWRVLVTVFCLHGLGLVAAGISLSETLGPHRNDFMSGVLEFLYHPFLPVFELLPSRTVFGVSDIYLSTCLLPIALSVLGIILWRQSDGPRRLDEAAS